MTLRAAASTATPSGSPDSAELYIRVRTREGRLFPDDIVARLPDLPAAHPLHDEWLARADSARRLLRHLRGLPRPITVLDLGCGNGWLSHAISQVPSARVWGLDRAGPELAQATRLFQAPNLGFLTADIFASPFSPRCFDVVLIASAIQYFPDALTLLLSLRLLLRPGGEIHILDSPVYSPLEVDAARQRTEAYFAGLGFPEMAACYFHHTTASLEELQPDYLYRPHDLGLRVSRRFNRIVSPFPWIRIRAAD